MMRRTTLPLLLALAACDDSDWRAARRELVAAEGAVTLDRPLSAGEIDMGGDVPREPAGGLESSAWKAWAARAWPAACARMTTVERVGRVAREGRRCTVVSVAGIVPSATVTAAGTLVTPDGALPIGWTWTTGDVANACAKDPIGTTTARFRLTRSRENQRWRATPLGVTTPIQDDPVRGICTDLPRFLNGAR